MTTTRDAIARLRSILAPYPDGLRGTYLRAALLEEGYTSSQIDGAREAVVCARGNGRHATWALLPPEQQDLPPRPPRPPNRDTLAAFRQEMGLTRSAAAVRCRGRLNRCSHCGVHIGDRKPGEPSLCLLCADRLDGVA